MRPPSEATSTPTLAGTVTDVRSEKHPMVGKSRGTRHLCEEWLTADLATKMPAGSPVTIEEVHQS